VKKAIQNNVGRLVVFNRLTICQEIGRIVSYENGVVEIKYFVEHQGLVRVGRWNDSEITNIKRFAESRLRKTIEEIKKSRLESWTENSAWSSRRGCDADSNRWQTYCDNLKRPELVDEIVAALGNDG